MTNIDQSLPGPSPEVQHHTSQDNQVIVQYSGHVTCIVKSQEPVTKEELLKEFSPEEKAVILSVPAASELSNLAKLVRFSKY